MSLAKDRIKAVFLDTLDRATGAERAAYLEEACAGDPALRQHVEALLQAHDQPDRLLDRPAAQHLSGEPNAEGTPGEQPGVVVASRYKLLEQIGEGGMGTVWAAEQTQPVRRKVALKFIKAGMDSRSVVSRFDAERQALAVMDHPNIARVLDGGTTEDGRPFFVMEYVKGVPITQYCDEARLGIAERLALVVAVCQAVQHAHQKGVIHRDLKPSNILVCLYDGTPVPKVIDFGLAKATHQPLTEHTLHTAHGVVMGTPLYMSPEQAEFNNLDVDTRTDIYSLGVILYELLTGTTPLEKQRFKAASWPEVLRLIKEEEPPRPSARLSGSGSLPGVAAQRQLEPFKLTKLMRGELDWIVMKSLEKDRARRYDTANGLAADLHRYLGGEPVLAHPPSTSYRLKKFVRRHRPQVLAAGVVLVALVAGVIGTSWGLVRAEEGREEAEGEKVRALEAVDAERRATEKALAAVDAERRATEAEKAAHEQAQKRLRQIEKGNEILTGIFADLDIRKIKAGDKPLEAVLAERLVKAAAQLEGESVGDPLAVEAMQDRLGQSLQSLGFAPQAIALLQKARDTRRARLGPDDPATLKVTHNLALGYLADRQLDRAIPLFEDTLRRTQARLGTDHPDTISCMGNLATAYDAARRLDKSLPLFEKTLALREAQLGPDDPATFSVMNNLALSWQAAGRLDKALPLFKEVLRRSQARLGPDHPDTLSVMNNLGEGYVVARQPARALPLLEEMHKLSKARLGLDHPGTLTGMNNLARAYQASGRLDKALPLYEETLGRSRAKLGSDHPTTVTCLGNLAQAFLEARQAEKALPLVEEFVRAKRTQLEKDSSQVALLLTKISLDLLEARQFPGAETYLKEALALREKGQPDAWYTFNTRSMLGGALLGQKKYAEAEPLLLSGYEGMKQRTATIPPPGRIRLTEAVQRLVALYEATGNKDAAARWRTELEKARTP